MGEIILRLHLAITRVLAVYLLFAGFFHAAQKALKVSAFIVRDLHDSIRDLRDAWIDLVAEVRRLRKNRSP